MPSFVAVAFDEFEDLMSSVVQDFYNKTGLIPSLKVEEQLYYNKEGRKAVLPRVQIIKTMTSKQDRREVEREKRRRKR